MSPAATARDAGAANPIAAARAVLAAKSKSFALAGRLLGPRERDRAAVVYAFCRRADDAIDLAPPAERAGERWRAWRRARRRRPRRPAGDPVLAAFGRVVRDRAIPRAYPDELLAGMAMDAPGHRYATTLDLLRYCYRVAGTVGLMMCHVLGLADDRALVPAVHLGIAMQLTNICRDVHEDWGLGRLYVPAGCSRRTAPADLDRHLGRPLPAACRPRPRPRGRDAARPGRPLLRLGRSRPRSICRGAPRSPSAPRAWCYAAIGERVRAQGCDPLAGRAVVPGRAKLALAGRASAASAAELPAASGEPAPCASPGPVGAARLRPRGHPFFMIAALLSLSLLARPRRQRRPPPPRLPAPPRPRPLRVPRAHDRRRCSSTCAAPQRAARPGGAVQLGSGLPITPTGPSAGWWSRSRTDGRAR